MNARQTVLRLIAMTVLLASSAAAVEVKVDFDPTVDFSQFKTLSWMEGTPAEDELLERKIHASIERELIPLGYKEAREDPDLLIVTHAAMDLEKEIKVSDFDYWLEYGGWKRPMATSQETWQAGLGVLVVDILEAQEKRLIWRGVATGNVAKNPEKRGKKLDETMARMFKKFPPK